jgi:hypothetical protein
MPDGIAQCALLSYTFLAGDRSCQFLHGSLLKGLPRGSQDPGAFSFWKIFVAWVVLLHSCATLSTSTQKIFTVMTFINKSAYLTVRVADKTRTKFHAKAKKFGTPSEVLRELIDAFIEDRVTINPPVTGNPKEKLYVPRSQD